MKHIVSFSGGKDSTAMLLMMIEKGMQIDEIINVDTGMEFPGMYSHIEKVKKHIYPLKIQTKKIDFNYWFQEYTLKKGNRKGTQGYGWPNAKFRWCTGLKTEALRSFLNDIEYDARKRKMPSNKELIGKKMYIAYSSEEEKRKKSDLNRNEVYPLIEWGITGKDALQYCYDKGFDWSELYEKFYRVSCWCCPLSRIGELKTLYKEFPELWKKLKKMDKKSSKKFRSDYSLDQLEDKFEFEGCLY
jgi:3'-phosphoadenosine 5'-phosphosulfate sulfotransferase (PAPS reductase)/FAD synthetase